jgi:TetR/AcrR family transcriptional regulator, transcriptional repressor for nem operon
MSINDVCQATGLTKGAVFHYVSDKAALGIAAAARFADRATQLFANAAYHEAGDPKDRLPAYVDQRQTMMRGGLADFTCLFGMIAQETYVTHPALSAACGDHMRNHAHTLEPDIAEAQGDSHVPLPHGPEGLALFMQAIVQGAFVISKAGGDPALAIQCLDHLRQYPTLLFSRQFGAT